MTWIQGFHLGQGAKDFLRPLRTWPSATFSRKETENRTNIELLNWWIPHLLILYNVKS